MRIKKNMATVLVSATAGVVFGATPANAATERNGILEPGEVGFHHRTQPGLVFDLAAPDSDFSDDTFPGTGIPVWGNTRQLRNRDTVAWAVYSGRNYTGSSSCLPPGHIGSPGPGPAIQSARPAGRTC